MSGVQAVLERARAAGRPSLVSYVTAGIRPDWTDLLAAMIEAGADAVEVGLPFSDPMLDGPVIQQRQPPRSAAARTPPRSWPSCARPGSRLAATVRCR